MAEVHQLSLPHLSATVATTSASTVAEAQYGYVVYGVGLQGEQLWRDAVRPQLGRLPAELSLVVGHDASRQLSLGDVEQGGVLAFQVVVWPEELRGAERGGVTGAASHLPSVRVVLSKVATEDEAGMSCHSSRPKSCIQTNNLYMHFKVKNQNMHKILIFPW